MRCLIVGGGETGKSIVRGLVKIKNISKIYIINRSLESSEKVVKELNNSKVEAFIEGKSLFFDYVIVTLCAVDYKERWKNIKTSKNTYEIRQKELKKNLLAIKEKLPFFRKLPKKVKFILMTNPVDGIENYLKNKLVGREIFGFGLQLDVNRYSKFFGKRVICVGVHGKTIPLLNLSSEKEYYLIYEKVDKPFLEKIKKEGLPYKVYENEFKKYFKKLISNKKELIYTSIEFEEYFSWQRGISIELPIYVKKGKIIGMKKIKLNSIEEEILKKDVEILRNSIKKYF